jgi:transcriptional/translational regulatory protein YebC/TACO1
MGGSLGETNSVSFMFDRIGTVRYPRAVASEDDMLEAAIDAGADNVESDDQAHEITAAPDQLITVRDALEARFGAPESAKLGWRPQTQIPVGDEPAEKLFKLLETLDDNDDVQNVIANYEVSDEALARLTA